MVIFQWLFLFSSIEATLFDIVAGVVQGDTFAPYLFIICLDYVFRTSFD